VAGRETSLTCMDQFEQLVDPLEKKPLQQAGDSLRAQNGRLYRIVEGIPVMLIEGESQTIKLAGASIDASKRDASDPLYLSTTGMGQKKMAELRDRLQRGDLNTDIDPVVNYLIGATNGHLYEGLAGKLKAYPIPNLNLPPAQGAKRKFLDVGCGWGRWSMAAAQKSYEVTAIDPSLGAVLAGRRVAGKLGLNINWVVGDARYLPFAAGSTNVAYSYSVLQHFDKQDATHALQEIGRVLGAGGKSLVQMPNAYGVRSQYHLWRRSFRDAKGFEVRYYSPKELLDLFKQTIGASELEVDGFFGLGLQYSDRDLMPSKYKAVLSASHALSRLSRLLPFLKFAADSLYVRSSKRADA
jgi:SAM-dependent methyltransferase/uncharacterized protein YbaR (Trm112 family)